jgi:hypothetical protein
MPWNDIADQVREIVRISMENALHWIVSEVPSTVGIKAADS